MTIAMNLDHRITITQQRLHILRPMPTLPLPTRLLNLLYFHLQVVIIILLFSQTIFINQQSWALQLTNDSSLSDQASDANSHQSDYAKPSANANTEPSKPIERFAPPNKVETIVDARIPSSQINQVNVRPSPGLQTSISGVTSFNQPNPNLNFNSTSRYNRDFDNVAEGSGDGPLSGSAAKRQQAKFDDTEDGEDDDDDEEDYDYKDSSDNGSGHGNQPPTTRKPERDPASIQSNNKLQKPNIGSDDLYLPFRPATTRMPTPAVPPSIKIMTSTTKEPTNWDRSTIVANNNNESNKHGEIKPDDPSRLFTLPNDNIFSEEVKISKPTTTSPPIKPISPAQETTKRPKQNVPISTTVSPPSMLDNQLKIPNVQVSNQGSMLAKHKHSNGSSSLPARNSSRLSDSDYDYEDENDDEDSDDVSNFEDNEPPQTDSLPILLNATVTATINQSVPYTTQQTTAPAKTIAFIQLATTTTAAPKTTILPHSNPTKLSTTNELNINPAVPIIVTQRPLTTVPPQIVSPSSESSSDYNDEDDDDDDDDDDAEIEEQLDGNEDGDEEVSDVQRNSNVYKPTSNSRPIESSSSSPKWTEVPSIQVPTYIDSANEQYKTNKNIPITTSTTPSYIRPNTQLPPNFMVDPTSEVTTSTTFPPTPPSTSTTTTTTTTTTTAPTTTTTTTTTTTRAPQPTIKPTLAPFYTSSTMRPTSIRYATTPRSMIIPVNRYSTIGPHAGVSQDGDIELTRHIYDKAVEVYQATNKALHAAMEAIWHPSMEVNSSTFEPLLTQPFLFMFVLGAAIIGLVLTMMLVVYIISYQIQPKDDVSIYSRS